MDEHTHRRQNRRDRRVGQGTRARAVAKALGYRVLMFWTTVLIAFAILDDPGTAFDLGLATAVVKTATYYGYERLWDRFG